MADTQISFSCNQGPRDSFEDAVGALNMNIPLPVETDITAAIVADGVGGNNFGEIASNQAVSSIKSLLAGSLAIGTRAGFLVPDAIQNLLVQSLAATNDATLDEIAEQPSLKGMSTTIVCVLIIDGILHVAWAGDSRCYLFGGGKLRQLTVDHSEVRRLIDEGMLAEKYAKSHPLSHTINQFIGMADGFMPETNMSVLSSGDVVILCTDGLTDVLSDDKIAGSVQKYQNGDFSFKRLPQYLAEQALAAGTTDNVTVLCCEYIPDAMPKFQFLDFTLTGAYPVKLAETLRNPNKEQRNVWYK